MPLWKIPWLIAVPWLYPIASAPLMVPMLLMKPLQLGAVLVATALNALHPAIAWVFTSIIVVWYAYLRYTPDPDLERHMRVEAAYGAESFFTQTAQVVLLAALLGIFLLAFNAWNFNAIGRWFAAFGVAYYFAGVASSYAALPEAVRRELALARLLRSP